MVAAFHLPEETLALHLFLQCFQRLIDVVVTHHDLNDVTLSMYSPGPAGTGKTLKRPLRSRLQETLRRSVVIQAAHDGRAALR